MEDRNAPSPISPSPPAPPAVQLARARIRQAIDVAPPSHRFVPHRPDFKRSEIKGFMESEVLNAANNAYIHSTANTLSQQNYIDRIANSIQALEGVLAEKKDLEKRENASLLDFKEEEKQRECAYRRAREEQIKKTFREDKVCAICQVAYTPYLNTPDHELPCGHWFHGGCLKTMAFGQRGVHNDTSRLGQFAFCKCPLCKSPFLPRHLTGARQTIEQLRKALSETENCLDEKNAEFTGLRRKCRRLISQGNNHNTVLSAELVEKLAGRRSLASMTFRQALLLAKDLEKEFTRPLYVTKYRDKFFVSFFVFATANLKKSGVCSTQTGDAEEHLRFYKNLDTAYAENELHSFCVIANGIEKLESDGTVKCSHIVMDADLTEYKETLNSRSLERQPTQCAALREP